MAEPSSTLPPWATEAETNGFSWPATSLKHQLRRHVYRLALPFVMLADGLIVGGTFLFTYLARFDWGWFKPAPPPPFLPYLQGDFLVAVVWIACLAFVGLYHDKRGASRFDDLLLTFAGLSLGALITLSLSFFYRSFSYSRLIYAEGFLASFLSLCAWHLAVRRLQDWARSQGWGSLDTLILGCNSLSALVGGRLAARPKLGYRIVGAIALPGDDPRFPQPVPVLGTDTDLPMLIAAHEIDTVIVAWPEASPQQLFGLVQAVSFMRPVSVQIAPNLLELMTAHLALTSLDGLPMLSIREVALRKDYNRAIKRLMDIVMSAFGLLAAAPALVAIAIAVKLSSEGPVFYAQERLGRDGHGFTIYKFRSMPQAAETQGPVWTSRGDDRATPIGAVLRRYSLDELPQLWNVLKGDMSLVGPRPERPFFVDQFRQSVPKYMDRHLVRSGLTGWAQVNGLRGDVDIEERTRFDLYYVENWSVLLDLRILLKTIREIFRRPGY